MNSLAKVQIPIEKIYLAINSPQVLNAQAITRKNEALTINSATDYSSLNAAVKDVNDAVKAIEAARKEAQAPFDAMCEKELPESFVGKEADVAALLRRIAKSW